MPSADAAMPDLVPEVPRPEVAQDTANADVAMLDLALDTARDLSGDLPGSDGSMETAPDAPKPIDVTVDALAAVDAFDPSVRFVQVTMGSYHACGLKTDVAPVTWVDWVAGGAPRRS